jgi:hypothetical protein
MSNVRSVRITCIDKTDPGNCVWAIVFPAKTPGGNDVSFYAEHKGTGDPDAPSGGVPIPKWSDINPKMRAVFERAAELGCTAANEFTAHKEPNHAE